MQTLPSIPHHPYHEPDTAISTTLLHATAIIAPPFSRLAFADERKKWHLQLGERIEVLLLILRKNSHAYHKLPTISSGEGGNPRSNRAGAPTPPTTAKRAVHRARRHKEAITIRRAFFNLAWVPQQATYRVGCSLTACLTGP